MVRTVPNLITLTTMISTTKVLVAKLDADCSVEHICIPFVRVKSFTVWTSEDRPNDIFKIEVFLKDGDRIQFVEIGLDSGGGICETCHLDDIYSQLLNGDY